MRTAGQLSSYRGIYVFCFTQSAALAYLNNDDHHGEYNQNGRDDCLPGKKTRHWFPAFTIQHKGRPEFWMTEFTAGMQELKLGQAQRFSFGLMFFQQIVIKLLHEYRRWLVWDAPKRGQSRT